MTDKGEITPIFGGAAWEYHRAGWRPLPLPPGAKNPPPHGTTGKGARDLTHVDVRRWVDSEHPEANIGVRLVHGFVGVDVDAYGDKWGDETLAAAEAAWGPLPPTLVSTARGAPERSGIRVFRLPDGPKHPRLDPKAEQALLPFGREVTVDGRSRVITHIDVISADYRYMVCWPSVNPDADGAIYRWYAPTADGYVPLDSVPSLNLVADLPSRWAQELAGSVGVRPDSEDAGRGAPNLSVVEGSLSTPSVGTSGAEVDGVTTARQLATLQEAHDLGIEVVTTESGIRYVTAAQFEAERDLWLARLAATPHGLINRTLYDTTIHLAHFMGPDMLKAKDLRQMLIEAQERAWIRSGGPDDKNYGDAHETITSGLRWVRNVGRYGSDWWWARIHVPGDDSEEGLRDSSQLAGANASMPASGAEVDARVEELEYAKELARQRRVERAREELRRERLERQASEESAVAILGQMIPSSRLADISPPEWLVGNVGDDVNGSAGVFRKNSVARVIGAGGTFKSFLMLSVASCVARGATWMGRHCDNEQGRPVVYVMAESVSGSSARVRAYEKHRGWGPIDNLLIMPRPVQMAGEEWPALVRACASIKPAMVVLDTQAKMTVGLEENSSTDTGLWVEAAERLRRETEACVVLIHHTGHTNGDRGRGSSAAPYGIDTEILVQGAGKKKDTNGINGEEVIDGDRRSFSIKVVRQKEGAEWETAENFRIVDVPGTGSVCVAPGNSLVPSSAERTERIRISQEASIAAASKHSFGIGLCLATFAKHGATKAELRAVYSAELVKTGQLPPGKSLANSSLYRAINGMHAQGWTIASTEAGSKIYLSLDGARALGVPWTPPEWYGPSEDEQAFLDRQLAATGVGGGGAEVRVRPEDDPRMELDL